MPTLSTAVRETRQKRDNELDFYPSAPFITRALIGEVLKWDGDRMPNGERRKILEPACGNMDMAKVLKDYGDVTARDIYDYKNNKHTPDGDFLTRKPDEKFDAIITNPPFVKATEFAVKALSYKPRPLIALLTRLTFVTGKDRLHKLFNKNTPSICAVFSSRLPFVYGKVVRKCDYAVASHCFLIWHPEPARECVLKWFPFDVQTKYELDSDYDEDAGVIIPNNALF